jgi:hypothetical protein
MGGLFFWGPVFGWLFCFENCRWDPPFFWNFSGTPDRADGRSQSGGDRVVGGYSGQLVVSRTTR